MNEAASIGWLRHNFLPSSETFIYESLMGLQAAGVSTQVLALNRKYAKKFPYENVTALNNSRLSWFGAASYWLTGRSIRARSWLRQLSLVHAHMGYTAAHGLSLARQAGLPLVTSFYGRDVTLAASAMRFAPQYLPYTLRREALMAEGDRFLVLSRHMRQQLLEQGYPATRIRVVRLGIDVDRFTLPAPRASTRTCTVLMIGREVQKKGFDDGLRACAVARARGADIRVVLLGTMGRQRPRLQQLAKELRLPVEWPNPKTSVVGLLAQAHILLAPSRTADNGDREGTPTVICEASAAGLPIVATRHAGIPEQVEHELTGLLTPERDLDELASALVTLAANEDRRNAMGAAGRQKMMEQYSLAAHTRALIQVYQELLPPETLLPTASAGNARLERLRSV